MIDTVQYMNSSQALHNGLCKNRDMLPKPARIRTATERENCHMSEFHYARIDLMDMLYLLENDHQVKGLKAFEMAGIRLRPREKKLLEDWIKNKERFVKSMIVCDEESSVLADTQAKLKLLKYWKNCIFTLEAQIAQYNEEIQHYSYVSSYTQRIKGWIENKEVEICNIYYTLKKFYKENSVYGVRVSCVQDLALEIIKQTEASNPFIPGVARQINDPFYYEH